MSFFNAATIRANKPNRNVAFIDSGTQFLIALQKNGRAWAAGSNSSGQLGDNSIVGKLTPISVLGAVKTFCKINAGSSHSLAIDKNGRAWGWGVNSSGGLGDNSLTSRLTPVSVAGAVKTFCAISAGPIFSLAIDKNGRAWAWGVNNVGQLGDNSIVSKLTPISVLGAVKTFCQISAGNGHSLAIDKNGRAWGWGYNGNGRIGDNSLTSRLTPVSIAGAVKTFCVISAGNVHSLAIDKNGRAWGWGTNSVGALGDNSIVSKLTPVSVAGAVKTFCVISAGNLHSLAIDKNGRAWGWGTNSNGELGDNSLTGRCTPVSVLGTVKTFCDIIAGVSSSNSFAIDKNGRAWGWGQRILGDGFIVNKISPISVANNTKTFCLISNAVNGAHSMVIDKNGRAWGWGYNGSGQLGDNSIISQRTPVSVLGAVKTFCKIASGNSHTMAIDKNGRAWGWGFNNVGQLGDNSIISQRTPVSVLGAVKTFCVISAGNNLSLAIDKNGRAWGWGDNSSGQLGDNSLTSRLTPVSVAGAVKTFCKIISGVAYNLAIDKNGLAWGWGLNSAGQLGDNSVTQRNTPVSVAGAVKTFCEITIATCTVGSRQSSVAIDKYGQAWSWGFNGSGQLGDGTGILSKRSPATVAGAVKTFCKVSSGVSFHIALDKNGRAWAWGLNNIGQLGDNSVTARGTPVSVAGAIKTFCNISSSALHSIAIDKYGRAWGWGSSTAGRLGDNTDGNPPRTPVRICNI